MRVTHFLNSMRPGHDGVTRVAYRLRQGFKAYPDKHVFVAPTLPKSANSDMLKVPSVPFPLSTDYRLPVCTPDSVGMIIKKFRSDVIHIHTPCTLGLSSVRAAEALNIPSIATYHTHFPTYLEYYKVEALRPWIWKYLKSLYRSCDAVIVPSKTTLLELQKEGGFKNLVHIPHGVDTRRFSIRHKDDEWRASVGGKNKIIVTFVGRLVWEKNLKLLAEAAKLVETNKQIRWVVVGDGPARAKFEKMMPNAHFTGFLGEHDLPTAYASSDIFVFPSVTETFGNVTIEAMASGLPAICVAAGGAKDIVTPGQNGFLSPPDDPLSFAQSIDLLVRKPELRAQLSQGALESSALYNWDNTVRRYREIYQNAVKSRNSRTLPKSAVSRKSRVKRFFMPSLRK
ncbi:MAG: glycosyltransferase family 1 protein [Bdellovibrionia bacterium]